MHYPCEAKSVLPNSVHTKNINKFIFSSKLDAKFLEKTYSENLAFGEKMFFIFLKTNPEEFASIDKAMQLLDYDALRSIAHKIKNNYTWVGLHRVSGLIYKIETAARAKSPEIVKLFQEFKREQKSIIDLAVESFSKKFCPFDLLGSMFKLLSISLTFTVFYTLSIKDRPSRFNSDTVIN